MMSGRDGLNGAGSAARMILAVAVLASACAVFAGCCGIPGTGEGARVEETFNQTVSAAGVSALDVENINGGCEVRAWDQPQVSIQATKRSLFGQDELRRVSISVGEGSTLTIRTDHPTPPARVTVDYVIMVPSTVGTIEIESSNGAVVADGVSAQVTARTSNGAVRVSGIGGGADLRTSNGAIEVRGAGGVVTAETSNGAITVLDAAGLGNLETSNGRIEAEARALFSDVGVRTSNGAIDIGIVPGLNAEIDAETSGGELTLPAGLLQVQEQTRNSLKATAGTGGHRLTIRTSNGQIRFAPAT